MKIKSFENDYAFLSNFYPSPIKIEGTTYPTVEHFYQSMKAVEMSQVMEIIIAETPGKAKRLGAKCKLVKDWDKMKIEVMKMGLKAKFEQHPKLRESLIFTGYRILEEGNYWRDSFWGIDFITNEGENHLGILLMELRETYASAYDK